MVPAATGVRAMTNDEFRTWLERNAMSQGALARLLIHLGDTAAPLTIRRRVERWAQGRVAVPGEAAALLNLLERFPYLLPRLRRDGWVQEAPRGRQAAEEQDG
jgi:DNA-binding transcriptional regulator YiaG